MLRLIGFLVAVALVAGGPRLARRPSGRAFRRLAGLRDRDERLSRHRPAVGARRRRAGHLVARPQRLAEPRRGRDRTGEAPTEARARCLVERHDRARRRRPRGRHARRDPGAQVAAERAADASPARAGRAACRRPHDGAPHLRSDARLPRYRAARPARPLPRGAARRRDRRRRGISPSARSRSTRSSPGRSTRCSICSAASPIGPARSTRWQSPASMATSSARRRIAAARCCSPRRRKQPRNPIRSAR